MNLATLTQMLGRLSTRTKLIAVAVMAFLVGTFFSGHSSESGNGRYLPWSPGAGQVGLLDTRTGQVWVMNSGARRFERYASIPYF